MKVINPKKVFLTLIRIIMFLLCANILGIVIKLNSENRYINGLFSLFDFDKEANIPTLYSSLTIMLASMILYSIALLDRRNGKPYIQWYGLAIVFLFLSIDEVSSIHERISPFIQDSFNLSGILYYSWVVPYSIFVILITGLYWKFLFKLPKRVFVLIILSGVIFLSGAIGFELIEARYDELYNTDTVIYAILYTCEEFLEMLGIGIFIYSLMLYIQIKNNSITFQFKNLEK